MGRGGAFYQFPLSPTLSPLVPRGEREAKRRKRFACRTQLAFRLPLSRLTSRIHRGRDARADSRDGCTTIVVQRRFMVSMRAQKTKEANHKSFRGLRKFFGPQLCEPQRLRRHNWFRIADILLAADQVAGHRPALRFGGGAAALNRRTHVPKNIALLRKVKSLGRAPCSSRRHTGVF